MSAFDDAHAALNDAAQAKALRVIPSPDRLVAALRALIAEHERLTAPPTPDEREALAEWQATDPGIDFMSYLSRSRQMGVVGRIVNGFAAGFRRQGPVTATEVIAAAKWWAESGNGEHPWPEYVKPMRGVLEAAREVSR